MSRARRIMKTSIAVARPGWIRRTEAAGRGSTGTTASLARACTRPASPAGVRGSAHAQELRRVVPQDARAIGRAEAEALDDATRSLVAHVEAVVAAEHHAVGADGLDQVPERARRVRDRVVGEPPEVGGGLAPGTVASLGAHLLAVL